MRYLAELVGSVYRDEDPAQCSASMAHQIIYGAIVFAREFGFLPHRDFELSQYILDAPGSFEDASEIEFGRDGKPFFIAGPDDNVPRILRQLESTAGHGQFDYIYGDDSAVPNLPDETGRIMRMIE